MLSAWPFRLKSRQTELLCILVPDFSSVALLLAVFPWHKKSEGKHLGLLHTYNISKSTVIHKVQFA